MKIAHSTRHGSVAVCLLMFAGIVSTIGQRLAAAPATESNANAFPGEPTKWHDGFDRYDFVMDTGTLAITPFKAPNREGFGVAPPAPGQRRCIVVVPKTPAPGNPWSWRGCYWDHQPQTEVELLNRGFHVAYISADATLKPGREWEAWYRFLTEEHGLSKRPAFVGMSRGGEYAYIWSTTHPDAVSCIYADNPGANPAIMTSLAGLAERDVPLLHVCGSIDPILGRNSSVIEGIYQQLGGRVSVMIKDGYGHHPHSLRDATPIADWIVQNEKPVKRQTPDFVPEKFTRDSFYGTQNFYRDSPGEGTHITCRGASFAGCYDRYSFSLPGTEGPMTVIVPASPAQGMPWVYRADFVSRDARVDLALLAKGFHIVTGPVPFNADGPHLAHWDKVYQHLVEHGFSPKPILEGDGAAASEAYAWAIAHPDRVSCIYAENPVFRRSTMSRAPILDSLAPLAKANIPILHVCGREDPGLAETTGVESRYASVGGHLKLIVDQGRGHYPIAPNDPNAAVEFILAASGK